MDISLILFLFLSIYPLSFLPFSGQSILLSIISWSVLVGGVAFVKHRFQRSQKANGCSDFCCRI